MDVGRLSPGRTCLIHAASGGIGQLLIQFGKRAGATIFATTSSTAKAEVARRHGADHVMLYNDGRFADEVREATGGRGVDVTFDSVGRATLRDSFRATRTRGMVVNYGSVSGSIADLDPIELGEAGSLFLTRPRLADHLADAHTVQRRADDVFAALLDGSLSISIAERYAFDGIGQSPCAARRKAANWQSGSRHRCLRKSPTRSAGGYRWTLPKFERGQRNAGRFLKVRGPMPFNAISSPARALLSASCR